MQLRIIIIVFIPTKNQRLSFHYLLTVISISFVASGSSSLKTIQKINVLVTIAEKKSSVNLIKSIEKCE